MGRAFSLAPFLQPKRLHDILPQAQTAGIIGADFVICVMYKLGKILFVQVVSNNFLDFFSRIVVLPFGVKITGNRLAKPFSPAEYFIVVPKQIGNYVVHIISLPANYVS